MQCAPSSLRLSQDSEMPLPMSFPPNTLTAAPVHNHCVQLLPSSLSVSIFHLREVPTQRRDEVEQMGGRKQAL